MQTSQQPQKQKRKYQRKRDLNLKSSPLPQSNQELNLPRPMEKTSKVEAWCAIINGFAASGELSPEELMEKGGDIRVRTLAVHAANLVNHFHSEFVKANGENIP